MDTYAMIDRLTCVLSRCMSMWLPLGLLVLGWLQRRTMLLSGLMNVVWLP